MSRLLCCGYDNERPKGDHQWSVRVNDQFRICFRWTGADTEDVEIVDYH